MKVRAPKKVMGSPSPNPFLPRAGADALLPNRRAILHRGALPRVAATAFPSCVGEMDIKQILQPSCRLEAGNKKGASFQEGRLCSHVFEPTFMKIYPFPDAPEGGK